MPIGTVSCLLVRRMRMRVRENGGAQTPQRWVCGGEGMDVILPRSPGGITIKPASLQGSSEPGLDSRFPAFGSARSRREPDG